MGPVARVKDFVHRNLDIVGVMDGRTSFVGPDTLMKYTDSSEEIFRQLFR